MTSEKMNACKRLVICSLSILFSLNVFAKLSGQHEIANVNAGSNCHGYLEYLPTGYDPSGSAKYPVLINILGLGSTGDGSLTSLNNLYNIHGGNPHDQAWDNSWIESYTVNGQTFKFIVITPQFMQDMLTHIPTAAEVNEVIDYIVSHYKVDLSRIYLIGSSQGAGAVWDYAGGSSQYAKRLAAIIPFAGVSFPFQEKANIMKFGKVAVWAFHNDNDPSVPPSFTIDYVNFYNKSPKPFGISAKISLSHPIPAGHECWFLPLTRQTIDNGLNVYQWLLQFQKDVTSANAGNDQEIVLPTSQAQLTATGTAPNGTASSYLWESAFGPTTAASIASSNSSTTNVTGLAQGTYIFKLTITGSDGSKASDYVAVTVNPTQTRIEDNAYTSIAPLDNSVPEIAGPLPGNPTSEGSNGNFTRVNNLAKTRWINYSVTVPSAGVYKFRFRAGSGTGGTRLKVQNADGTQDLSLPVVMYVTSYEDYMDFYADVTLQAGTQTIRITSNPISGFENKPWFINWFEVISNTQATYASDAPLPVNFSAFNVNCSGNKLNFTWKTVSENNSSTFSIEKSSDGATWETLAIIPAAGQSSVEKSYRYVGSITGLNDFYRIAQQDVDGKKTYTPILKSNCNGQRLFSVFPNPVNDRVTLIINADQNERLNLSLADSKGTTVRKQQTLLPQGSNQVNMNLSGLPKGIYTLQAEWGGEIRTTKLIKN